MAFSFFFATWMHNDGPSRKLPEKGNPVSALLGSLGRKGFGSYRFIKKKKKYVQEGKKIQRSK